MFTMCPFPSLYGRCNAAVVSGESSISLASQGTKPLFSFFDFMCLLFFCRDRFAKTQEMGITLTVLAGRFVHRCFCVRGVLGARVPMPWALINYAFLAAMIGFPAYMLRHWNTFNWR